MYNWYGQFTYGQELLQDEDAVASKKHQGNQNVTKVHVIVQTDWCVMTQQMATASNTNWKMAAKTEKHLDSTPRQCALTL